MSRRGPRFCSFSLLLLIAGITLAQSSSEIVAVTGTVFSEDGKQRLENAMVNLCDASGNLIQQGATSIGGHFAFRGLRRNEYMLKVTADSFEPQEVDVNLQFGSQPATCIYMKRVPADPAKTANLPNVTQHELAMPASARTVCFGA